MTAARSCWKRLNTELEDGDECLPISKRICSLHIEPQTQDFNSQSNHGVLVNPYSGFSDSAVTSPAVVGLDPWSAASQPNSSCRLDFNNELSPSTKAGCQLLQENSAQGNMNQRMAPGGAAAPHFCHLVADDPRTAHFQYQQKLDPNCNQIHLENLHCMPHSSYDKQITLQQNQSQRLNIPSDVPSIQSSIHPDSFSIPYHQGMPEYNQDFHIQQLPTGTYEPELGVDENPYYYCVNQMLYEAHLYRVRRGSIFSNSS